MRTQTVAAALVAATVVDARMMPALGRFDNTVTVFDPAVDAYYQNVDTSSPATLKAQLHSLINPHVVFTYDQVWGAFASIDRHLPGYPCNANNASYIPDIYSSYCWRTVQDGQTGGECGK